jgi:hypothetical protein
LHFFAVRDERLVVCVAILWIFAAILDVRLNGLGQMRDVGAGILCHVSLLVHERVDAFEI